MGELAELGVGVRGAAGEVGEHEQPVHVLGAAAEPAPDLGVRHAVVVEPDHAALDRPQRGAEFHGTPFADGNRSPRITPSNQRGGHTAVTVGSSSAAPMATYWAVMYPLMPLWST